MKRRIARAAGEVEYANMHGPDRLEQVLRTSGHAMPLEIRSRLEGKLRELRARAGHAPEPAPKPVDLTTDAGRAEHAERLLAEVQADRLLEGI